MGIFYPQLALQGDEGTFVLRDGIIIRLDKSGQLDPTFAGSGALDLPGDGKLGEIGVDLDGRLLATLRYGNTSSCELYRYLANGQMDTSFGVGGSVVFNHFPGQEDIESIDALLDGGVLVNIRGTTFSDGSARSALVKLDATGQVDSTFGREGWWNAPKALQPLVDSSGIYVATFDPTTMLRLAIQRLSLDGVLDASYGGEGGVEIPTNEQWFALSGLDIDRQGRLLVGITDNYNRNTISRLTTAGEVDASFGDGGHVVYSYPNIYLGYLVDLDVQENGKIVLGFSFSSYGFGGTNQIYTWGYVVRLLPDGTPEASFGPVDSTLGLPAVRVGGHVQQIEIAPNGRLVLAEVHDDSHDQYSLARVIQLRGDPPPTPFSLSNLFVDENAAKGSVIGTFIPGTAADDARFELRDDADGRFRLEGNTLLVERPELLDYETKSFHTLRVRSIDPSGRVYDRNVTIFLNNLNETPVIGAPFDWLTRPDVALPLSGIVLADPDLKRDALATKSERLTIVADHGRVHLDSQAELLVMAGGNDTSLLILQGSLNSLNQTIATLQFLPDAGFSGVATVLLSLDDLANAGSGPALSSTIGLEVVVNTPPTPENDRYRVAFGRVFDGPSVLANDRDRDLDELAVILVDGPQHGSLQFAADGSFKYLPNAGFFGVDSFRYRAVDRYFESDAVEATLEVGVGDADLDGDVDLTDFGILKQHFGTGTTRAEGDLSGDGRVDLTDFGILKAAFANAVEEDAKNRKAVETRG